MSGQMDSADFSQNLLQFILETIPGDFTECDHELVSAVSHFVFRADTTVNCLPHPEQYFIPRQVAELVINLFEPVNVDDGHSTDIFCRHDLIIIPAVMDLCQGVDVQFPPAAGDHLNERLLLTGCQSGASVHPFGDFHDHRFPVQNEIAGDDGKDIPSVSLKFRYSGPASDRLCGRTFHAGGILSPDFKTPLPGLSPAPVLPEGHDPVVLHIHDPDHIEDVSEKPDLTLQFLETDPPLPAGLSVRNRSSQGSISRRNRRTVRRRLFPFRHFSSGQFTQLVFVLLLKRQIMTERRSDRRCQEKQNLPLPAHTDHAEFFPVNGPAV